MTQKQTLSIRGALHTCLCLLALPCFSQQAVDSWVSSEDNQYQLSRQLPFKFAPSQASSAPSIRVDAGRRYQTMLGLGSSLEATTCANISRLDPKRQDEVIERLVHPVNGIGMNLMRICIGTSDFTGDAWYSYDDVPAGQTDVPLARFSIEKDRTYILPVLKKALQKNPNLLFFASPWSPPGWMKTSGSMIGGSLLPQYNEPYARYLVRFVQAYEAEGVPIYAITVQNEPGVDRQYEPRMAYPSSKYTGETERDGRYPDYTAAHAYDAANVVIAGIRQAGLNRPRIRDAVQAISPARGITGVIEWDAQGQNHRAVSLQVLTSTPRSD